MHIVHLTEEVLDVVNTVLAKKRGWGVLRSVRLFLDCKKLIKTVPIMCCQLTF